MTPSGSTNFQRSCPLGVGARRGEEPAAVDRGSAVPRRAGPRMTGTTMLYHYFRKFDGNVCMDWRLTSDLSTSLQTTSGKTERVNSKAFEQFLNPEFKGTEAGSCQGAGPLCAVRRPRAPTCSHRAPRLSSPRSSFPRPRLGADWERVRSRVRGQTAQVCCVCQVATGSCCLPRAAHSVTPGTFSNKPSNARLRRKGLRSQEFPAARSCPLAGGKANKG